MNTIPAQEIKQRGIGAVDDLLANGPVHVITRNRPRYVVMDEDQYNEWLAEREELLAARAREAMEDIRAGRVREFTNPDDLRQAMLRYGQASE